MRPSSGSSGSSGQDAVGTSYALLWQVDLSELAIEGDNEVTLRYSGLGNLMYQLVASYHLPWAESEPSAGPVSIDVVYDKTQLAVNDTVTVTVTVTLHDASQRGMILVDLGRPPGFTLAAEDLAALRAGVTVVAGGAVRDVQRDAAGGRVAGVLGARVVVVAREDRPAGLAGAAHADVAHGAGVAVVALERVGRELAAAVRRAGVRRAAVLVVAGHRVARQTPFRQRSLSLPSSPSSQAPDTWVHSSVATATSQTTQSSPAGAAPSLAQTPSTRQCPAWSVQTQPPTPSQASSVQSLPSSQTWAVPVHVPPSRWSPRVHGSPSSQASPPPVRPLTREDQARGRPVGRSR
jgi:hypothetical protein